MQKKVLRTTVTFLLYYVYVVTMSENSSPEKVNIVQCQPWLKNIPEHQRMEEFSHKET